MINVVLTFTDSCFDKAPCVRDCKTLVLSLSRSELEETTCDDTHVVET